MHNFVHVMIHVGYSLSHCHTSIYLPKYYHTCCSVSSANDGVFHEADDGDVSRCRRVGSSLY